MIGGMGVPEISTSHVLGRYGKIVTRGLKCYVICECSLLHEEISGRNPEEIYEWIPAGIAGLILAWITANINATISGGINSLFSEWIPGEICECVHEGFFFMESWN